jgi:hypothetical protein
MNVGSWVPENDQWHKQMATVQENILKFIKQENKDFKSKNA